MQSRTFLLCNCRTFFTSVNCFILSTSHAYVQYAKRTDGLPLSSNTRLRISRLSFEYTFP